MAFCGQMCDIFLRLGSMTVTENDNVMLGISRFYRKLGKAFDHFKSGTDDPHVANVSSLPEIADVRAARLTRRRFTVSFRVSPTGRPWSTSGLSRGLLTPWEQRSGPGQQEHQERRRISNNGTEADSLVTGQRT